MEPNGAPLPAAFSGKRDSKMTEKAWKNAQSELLKVEQNLKKREEDIERLLALMDRREDLRSTSPKIRKTLKTTETTKINISEHEKIERVLAIVDAREAPTHTRIKKTLKKRPTKNTNSTKNTKINVSGPSQCRPKLSNSQQQELMALVTRQMRLMRYKPAIIDMALVLLTSALVAGACLWAKVTLLLSSCLLVCPLLCSMLLATSGRVMGPKLLDVFLSLAAAVALADFCPPLIDYTMGSHSNSQVLIYMTSCIVIAALSGISVAGAAMRSASSSVELVRLWGFLLPPVLFANLLWISASLKSIWSGNAYCTYRALNIMLAVFDMIYLLLTLVVVREERLSSLATSSFLSEKQLKIVRSYTRKYYQDQHAAKHVYGSGEKRKPKERSLVIFTGFYRQPTPKRTLEAGGAWTLTA